MTALAEALPKSITYPPLIKSGLNLSSEPVIFLILAEATTTLQPTTTEQPTTTDELTTTAQPTTTMELTTAASQTNPGNELCL